MQMNGPDRPKSNLSHFSGLNKVWPGRSPQAIKPDDVLRCQTACSRMRATTVGDGQAEHDLIAPWRVPDGQFSGGEVASYIGCPNMPERDHEPAPQRGDRLGRGYDCFGIAQSFAQCPASRFVPHGARSEERRVGKECVTPGRYRWWPT